MKEQIGNKILSNTKVYMAYEIVEVIIIIGVAVLQVASLTKLLKGGSIVWMISIIDLARNHHIITAKLMSTQENNQKILYKLKTVDIIISQQIIIISLSDSLVI